MAGKLRRPHDEDEDAGTAESNQETDDSEDDENPLLGDDVDVDDNDEETDDDGDDEDDDDDDDDDASDDSESDASEDGNDGEPNPTQAHTAANRVKRMLFKQPLSTIPMCLQALPTSGVAVGTVDGQVQLFKLVTAPRATDADLSNNVFLKQKLETSNSEIRSLSLETAGSIDLKSIGQRSASANDSVRALCLPFSSNTESGKSFSRASSSSKSTSAGLSNSTLLAATKSGYLKWLDLEKTCISRSVGAGEASGNATDKAISCILPLNEHAVAVGFDAGGVAVVDCRETKNARSDADAVLKVECDSKDQIADLLLCEDGRTLLAAGGDGFLYTFDTRNRKQLLQSERLAELTSLATIGRGRRHVVAGSLDGRLYIFNDGQYGAPSDMYGGHKAEINSVVSYPASDDGNMLLTGDGDGHLRLLHLFPHKQVAYVGKQDSVEKMSILPDGGDGRPLLFVLNEIDEELKIWDCSKLVESLKTQATDTIAESSEASTSGGKRVQPDEGSGDSEDSSDDDDEKAGSSKRRSEDKKSRKMPRMDPNKAKNEEFFADMA